MTSYECLRGAICQASASQNKATFSGVLQKKKKKGHHLSGVKFRGIFSYRLFFGDQT